MVSEQELRKKIMRRVYGVYLFRQVTSVQARIAAFAVLLFALASSVSLPDVIANALHAEGLVGIMRFVVVALTDTTTPVQLSVLGASLLVLWTLADLIRRQTHSQLSLQ